MSTRSERRREAQGKGSSNMTKVYLIIGVAAVVGVGAVGYSVGRGNAGATMAPIEIPGLAEDMERLAALAQGETKGDPDAPVQIIEFGDYSCPGCMAFATQVKPAMELALVESGKAQFVFYDFPITDIHPNSFVAARAARCAADQGRFWDYHDQLFRAQSRWSMLANATAILIEYSRTLDMDDDAFEACVRSDAHADVVTANMQLGQVMGVPSTPTILIAHDGQARQVSPDLATITEYVNGLLAESGSE